MGRLDLPDPRRDEDTWTEPAPVEPPQPPFSRAAWLVVAVLAVLIPTLIVAHA